jgi:uncharacterized protein (DUF427 family)
LTAAAVAPAVAPTIPLLENILITPVPATGYSVTLEPIQKRVRAFVSGVAVVDSARVMMMRETAHLGVYYFPVEDVRLDLLIPSGEVVASPYKGDASYFHVEVGGRVVEDAAWRYLNPLPDCPDISGYIAFHWREMDAWYEEDEEVFVHARDPKHRIDVLESSRHVRVVVGGKTVADTRRAVFLFETSLPVRYYIPKLDVRFDLLRPSPMRTACAYKGRTTAYWSAETTGGSVRDVAWSYEAPRLEATRIANMVAFFNERVDAIFVDGVEMPTPETMWG